MNNKKGKDSEINDLTRQLESLKIDCENNRNKLLQKKNRLLSKKASNQDINRVNPFNIGQRIIICNNYSGDYGTNTK